MQQAPIRSDERLSKETEIYPRKNARGNSRVVFSTLSLKFIFAHRQTADDVPKLCHAIEQYLSLPNEKRKNPLAYFLTADEFEKWVAEKVGIKLAEDEKKVAVEYLDSSGIVSKSYIFICESYIMFT